LADQHGQRRRFDERQAGAVPANATSSAQANRRVPVDSATTSSYSRTFVTGRLASTAHDLAHRRASAAASSDERITSVIAFCAQAHWDAGTYTW
jgi:hypothetical protein